MHGCYDKVDVDFWLGAYKRVLAYQCELAGEWMQAQMALLWSQLEFFSSCVF